MGRFLWDQATGQLFDKETRLPLPVEPPSPPPTAEEIAARRERVRQRLARDEAKREAFWARLARRPVEMQRDGYVLPADVAAFLKRLHDEPTFYYDEVQISTDQAKELVAAAYMEGCRQGFIEGFVERRMPDKKRSDTGNAAKRRTLVQLPDGRRMTRDERDALMVAEHESLLALKVKPTPAMERLAEKYGFESWQGVAAAMKSFGKRSGR
jgi:hypothetical protein